MEFLKIYGGTAKAAMELMDCSYDEAQEAIDEFDARFPGVNKYIEDITARVERDGYIENRFGRVYYIDRQYAYKGVNYRIQGTCADMVKRAMVRLGWKFRKDGQGVRTLLTIHDELVIEVPLEVHSKRLQSEIVKIMQTDSKRLGIPIPLPITMKTTSDRWSNAKE